MAVIQLTPAVVDLYLYRGDDAFLSINVTTTAGAAADLTGAIPRSQIRASYSAETVLAEFDASVTGDIIYLRLPGAASATLPPKAVWDLQVTWPDGVVTTIVAGAVRASGEVTR